jgi:hypothetical protein
MPTPALDYLVKHASPAEIFWSIRRGTLYGEFLIGSALAGVYPEKIIIIIIIIIIN